MVTLSLTLSEPVLLAALSEATIKNVSLEAFIGNAIMAAIASPTFEPRPVTNLQTALQAAVDAAKSKGSGEKFLLKNLCDPESWESITVGERKIFGKIFRQAIEDCGIAEMVGKTSSNQAIYQRT